MTQIQNSNDLLAFLLSQANSGDRDWFGYKEQRVIGISLVYEIAANNAATMSAEEIVDYVIDLNNMIHKKMIRPPNDISP
jgi:hypothetical protein